MRCDHLRLSMLHPLTAVGCGTHVCACLHRFPKARRCGIYAVNTESVMSLRSNILRPETAHASAFLFVGITQWRRGVHKCVVWINHRCFLRAAYLCTLPAEIRKQCFARVRGISSQPICFFARRGFRPKRDTPYLLRYVSAWYL